MPRWPTKINPFEGVNLVELHARLREMEPYILRLAANHSAIHPEYFDDLAQTGRIEVAVSMRKFDPSFRARFATFAYARIRWQMINYVRSQRQLRGAVVRSLYEPVNAGAEYEDILIIDQLSSVTESPEALVVDKDAIDQWRRAVDAACIERDRNATHRNQVIADATLKSEDDSYNDVAKRLRITHQAVEQRRKKIVARAQKIFLANRVRGEFGLKAPMRMGTTQ